MNRIIDRYIFLELIPPFVISVVFFTFVFLMAQILPITEIIVNYQVNAKTIALFLLFSMPFFLQFILPLSVMLSVLLTFLRMSGDMEIVALKAGGVTVYRLLPAVLLFGLIAGLLTAFMSIVALPHSRLAYKRLQFQVASNHLELGLIHLLKPRQFIDEFSGVVLYVHEVDPSSHTLKDVFIEKRISQDLTSTIIAPRGTLFIRPHEMDVNLRLYDGGMYQVDVDQGSSNIQSFSTHDIRLDIKQSIKSIKDQPKDEEEMSLRELYDYLNQAKKRDDQFYITLMEWHKKFSLPTACLVLSLLAVPLGIQARSSKRSYGIGLGMIFFFLYYILLAVGWVFGEAGTYPPIIGMWLPNMVMACLGMLFLIRAANEKSFLLPPVGLWIKSLIMRQNM